MVRLYPLHLGSLDMDQRAIVPASAPGQWIRIPVPGYLIRAQDPSGGEALVLVDTGMARAVLSGAAGIGKLMRPAEIAGAFVTERLAELGVRPADLTHIVATHFHFDHAGGLESFPGTPIVVQRAALAAARDGRPRERAIAENTHLNWRVVDGDVELLPGVRLLETPGHTPGHQSVLVETASGPFLLAIDAIYSRAQLAADDWGAYADQDIARASARKVQRIAAETGATLVYGHDAAQWAGLRHAPAYYD